ncbi:MAG: metal ABC transporter permease [Bacteroidota bacterium]
MFQLEIQLIAVVTAGACALLGSFLILRRVAMMSDVISHAILPGIVVAFFITEDLASPLLIIGAALTGVLTVALVEVLERTRLVREDAAMGFVFPVLFSIGVILIAQFAGEVHLDVDAVLLGELAFAPFNRFTWGGTDLGPQALWLMGGIFVVDILFVLLFFKELKLTTFDAGLASALGFMPAALHYGLMTLVSVTAVGAFDAVGSILVVALMIGPPAAAYLLTDRLGVLLALSVGLGAASAVGGYWIARALDASIAGSMAGAIGLVFAFVFLAAPKRGVVAVLRRRRLQRWDVGQKMLTVHLLHHEGTPAEPRESRVAHLHEHVRWTPAFARGVVSRAERSGLVVRQDGTLHLTDVGRTVAQKAMVE